MTDDDLRTIATELARAMTAGTAGDHAATDRALAAVAAELERRAPGPLVFRLELGIGTDNAPWGDRAARAWAPTLNEYNKLKPWQKARAKKAIDAAIFQASFAYPRAGLSSGIRAIAAVGPRPTVEKRRRLVIVTRCSSRRPDELAADVIGGKMPIDALVRAGVLAGDSDKWVERVPRWEPANLGEGRVVVAVHELKRAP